MKISKLFQYMHAFQTSLIPYIEQFREDELFYPGGVPEHLIHWEPELIAAWLSFDLQQTPIWTVDYVKEIMKSVPGEEERAEETVPRLYDALTKGYVSLFHLTKPAHSLKQEMRDLLLDKKIKLHFTQREEMRESYVLARVFPLDGRYFFFNVIGNLTEEEGNKLHHQLKGYFYEELNLEKISIADLKTLFPEILQQYLDFKNTVEVISHSREKLRIDDFLGFYFSPDDQEHFRRFYFSFTKGLTPQQKDSIWYSLHKFFINFLTPMGMNFSTLTPGILKASVIQGAQKGLFYQKRELLWLLIILRSWFEFAYIDTKNRKFRELLEAVQLLENSFFELLRYLRVSSQGIYTDAGLMAKLTSVYLPLKGGVLDDFKTFILQMDGARQFIEGRNSFFPVDYETISKRFGVTFPEEERLGEEGRYLYANILYYFAIVKSFVLLNNGELETTENFYSYLGLSEKDQLILWIQAIFNSDFLENMLEQLPHSPGRKEIRKIYDLVIKQEAVPKDMFYVTEVLRRFYLVEVYTSTRFALTEFGEEVLSYYGIIPSVSQGKILSFPQRYDKKSKS